MKETYICTKCAVSFGDFDELEMHNRQEHPEVKKVAG
ncbi:C2H2-type zinc finger protein [Candidatus Woesearchaeota archaeon]|nr:C2H2-type zinc finger protein [Candidatus Woesearchaeota archaeon]